MTMTSPDRLAQAPRDLAPALMFAAGACVVGIFGQLVWQLFGLGPDATWPLALPTFAMMVWAVDIGLWALATGALIFGRGPLRRQLILHSFLLMGMLDLALPQMLHAI